ncbi:MAG: FAD-dependent oxidoreductase [Sphingobium sp.]
MQIAHHVAIVGGGFSGTLLAINLLRHGALKVTLIEREPDRLARGCAYGAAQPDHVLNVRAGNMGAFPDQPGHFAQWLERRGSGTATCFATRRDYGQYLSELLAETQRQAGHRLTVMLRNVEDALFSPQGASLILSDGGRIEADMIVLAQGNLPPHDLTLFRQAASDAYIPDPWAADLGEGLRSDDSVLLIGTGLTAVDCILTLDAAGFRGRMVALSRRGLMPHVHETEVAFRPRRERPRGSIAELAHEVRARARDIGWRNAVDELRPFTQDIWSAADFSGQSRFLRHLRPYWDIHRHRIAPQVRDRLEKLKAEGRLRNRAGKIIRVTPMGGGLEIGWRPRQDREEQVLRVSRAINCTGPLSDLRLSRDMLLQRLHERGFLRPDPHHIGIDVDRTGRAVNAGGGANDRLFVVGPMTRGACWEIVAVPDIRKQVWTLARALTGSHWVEAEGL